MRFTVSALLALALTGCGLLLDLDPPDPQLGWDAGRRDAGSVEPCVALPLGASCGDEPYRVCSAEGCRPSRCGDGIVDPRLDEDCDDGNDEPGDGCEPGSCTPTCRTDEDCGARGDCVTPRCAESICTLAIQPHGAPCGTEDGTCDGSRCVDPACGDGMLDAREECDDGNRVPNDGCEPDCTLSCRADVDCDDGVVCNGVERCAGRDGSLPRCVAGEPLAPPPCFRCSLASGDFELIDEDGDGFAPGDCGAFGGDCDDLDPTVYPGAPDWAVPPNGIDEDCDGRIDEDVRFVCLRDADGDGFGDATTSMADENLTTCPAGYVRVPADSTTVRTDCDDNDANVFPGQTAWFAMSRCASGPVLGRCYDYNCNGVEEQRFRTSCGGLLGLGCRGEGWHGAVPSCGGTGSYGGCSLVLGLCTGILGSRRAQECR